jgi:hypothetical protein
MKCHRSRHPSHLHPNDRFYNARPQGAHHSLCGARMVSSNLLKSYVGECSVSKRVNISNWTHLTRDYVSQTHLTRDYVSQTHLTRDYVSQTHLTRDYVSQTHLTRDYVSQTHLTRDYVSQTHLTRDYVSQSTVQQILPACSWHLERTLLSRMT